MSFVSTKWKTLSKKLLLENKYYSLWEDQVERPDGETSLYYVNRRDPFSIIIPFHNGNVYLVKQYRYAVSSLSIEFSMGYVAGKSPRDTAITELKEETGITSGKLTEIGKFWIGPGRTNQFAHVFIAEDLEFGKQQLEDGEFIEVFSVPVEKVQQMIEQGEILDGPTIVAYHLFEKYLEK